MRFVAPLDDQTKAHLQDLMKTHPVSQVRHRAHALLLSAQGYPIKRLAEIFFVDRETITNWLNRFDQDGLEGLENKPRPGRPRSIDPTDETKVLHEVRQEPRQLKTVLARLSRFFSVSIDTIKRLLKRHGYRWRRVRRSLKSQRDEAAFRTAHAEVKALQKQEALGEIDLVYFDEAGFSLVPVVPYAWQAPGQQIELPARTHHRRVNVLGFLKRDNTFAPYLVEGSVSTEMVMACIDAFAQGLRKTTVLVLDRAPIHTAKALQAARARWREKGLRLFFLPSYSPELNLIERLWQEIKYRWLPLWAYEGWPKLKEALEEVLVSVGEKYQISFA
jgi:transposase